MASPKVNLLRNEPVVPQTWNNSGDGFTLPDLPTFIPGADREPPGDHFATQAEPSGPDLPTVVPGSRETMPGNSTNPSEPPQDATTRVQWPAGPAIRHVTPTDTTHGDQPGVSGPTNNPDHVLTGRGRPPRGNPTVSFPPPVKKMRVVGYILGAETSGSGNRISIPNSRLRWLDRRGRQVATAVSQYQGRFGVEVLPGRYRVHIDAPRGFVSRTVELTVRSNMMPPRIVLVKEGVPVKPQLTVPTVPGSGGTVIRPGNGRSQGGATPSTITLRIAVRSDGGEFGRLP